MYILYLREFWKLHLYHLVDLSVFEEDDCSKNGLISRCYYLTERRDCERAFTTRPLMSNGKSVILQFPPLARSYLRLACTIRMAN